MKKSSTPLLPFVLLVFLVSCEEDITDQFAHSENQFVISGRVVAGQSPLINLTRGSSIIAADTLLYLNNAQMELRRGNDLYQLAPKGRGFYGNAEFLPASGETLVLTCSGEGLTDAGVVLEIPAAPSVHDLDFQVDENLAFTLEITLDDPAGSDDFYGFFLSGWRRQTVRTIDQETGIERTDTSQIYLKYGISLQDPIIKYTGGPRGFSSYDPTSWNSGPFYFSDMEIDGSSHRLMARGNLNQLYNDTIPELHVTLLKHDVHFFRFLESFMHYDPMPDQDFLQKVQVYSNIEGGFGLVTAEAPWRDTIDLSPWFSDPDFQEGLNDR
ncbi:MAG: DUF4249 family protein [Bacteroidales bacterium]